ncbi:MAG: TSUP family transporter, partial [Paracoccaceae bacterium]|nr:TSUP family transporter [Paracoccaceae bacterium]
LLAFLASALPPLVLIPVHGVVQAGSNAGRALNLLRFISWRDMPGFVLGSVLGVGLGGALVVNIPPYLVQIGIGGFIIWSVFSRPPAWLRRFPVLTGAISSFLTMFFGATGLFVANFTKSLTLDRHGHVATHAALMGVQHLLKTVAFGFLGFVFLPWLGFIAGMILAGFAGTLVGRAVLNRISDARFRMALDVVLVLISARLIWGGLVAGWG